MICITLTPGPRYPSISSPARISELVLTVQRVNITPKMTSGIGIYWAREYISISRLILATVIRSKANTFETLRQIFHCAPIARGVPVDPAMFSSVRCTERSTYFFGGMKSKITGYSVIICLKYYNGGEG